MSVNPGDLIGARYRLREKIGEGGAAVVFRALDVRLGRPVAVKVLKSGIAAEPESLARFRREAQAAAAFIHPNIVTVYDYGETDNIQYMVLELMPGPTLREFMSAKGALSTGRAVAIVSQVLAGLKAAHLRELIHRDIKPANILFAEDGVVKVADFGIARALGSPSLTSAGNTMGTALYLSPEQARGEPAGPASDIYSTGVVLYEMLAGSPPFEADNNLALALKHISEQPRLLALVAPHVPPGLSAIVHRALAKAPDDRYSDAADMARALADVTRLSEQQTSTFTAVKSSPLDVTTVVNSPAGLAAVGEPRHTQLFIPLPGPRPAASARQHSGGSGDDGIANRDTAPFLIRLCFWVFAVTLILGLLLVASNRGTVARLLGSSVTGETVAALGTATSPAGANSAGNEPTPVSAASLITATAQQRPAASATQAAPAKTVVPSPTAPSTPTARPTSTPVPPTITPTPTPPLLRATMPASSFAGACKVEGLSDTLQVKVVVLFGGKSDCPRASANFDLPSRAVYDSVVTLSGAASQTDLPDVEVLVNGKTLYDGRSPFTDDRSVGEIRWKVPDGALRGGLNRIEVRNLSKSGQSGKAPWLALAGATIEYR